MFATTFLVSCMLALSSALLQATIISASPPAAAATAEPIPWATKIDAFRAFLLLQPDTNATKFRSGPFFQQRFADGDCIQIAFLNWDCNHDIPYKMRGVARWLDDQGFRGGDGGGDKYRWYVYGYYADPDDGWNFYDSSRLSFGFCGNRGPQSSCGHTYCVDENGKSNWGQQGMDVPKGQTPWMDPNDRDRLCPWLRDDATSTMADMSA